MKNPKKALKNPKRNLKMFSLQAWPGVTPSPPL